MTPEIPHIPNIHGITDRYPEHCQRLTHALSILIQSCREALSGEWDRSDDGFEDMIELAETALAAHSAPGAPTAPAMPIANCTYPEPPVRNHDRAHWAALALSAFAHETGSDMGREALHDLLCDLGHYAASLGLDFAEEVQKAIETWAEEKAEEAADRSRR